ncbi:MAG: TIGR00730 family Rossman fold protein [Vicinamibacterales bacterium]
MPVRRLCVFCGSSTGARPDYTSAAVALAEAMTAAGVGLVYGGGAVGLMGVVADAVRARGGEAIGVIPRALAEREIAHRGLSELHVVASMHERKALMADLADAFIAMPGGFGTFEEFCEVVTWTQLGLHPKRCGLLNVSGYYDALLAQFDRATADGFIRPANRRIVIASADPVTLVDAVLRPVEAGSRDGLPPGQL